MSWLRPNLMGPLGLLVFFAVPLFILLHWPGDRHFWLRVALDEPIMFLFFWSAMRP